MDKQELKQLIKDSGCNYSEATINYLVNNTKVNFIPTFTSNTGLCTVNHTSIYKYRNYFFNQQEHQQVLINNGDLDTSDVMTKFKIGDVVYYFDKDQMTLIRGQITSIDNHVSLTQNMFKGPYAYSQVGIKRLDEDVDFVYTTITNNDLFLTIKDAFACLTSNTSKLEQKRKQEMYEQSVQDELSKFNSINDN